MTNSNNSEQNNDELSTEDLKKISGGAAFVKLGDIKGELSRKTSQDSDTYMTDSSTRCTTMKNKQEP